MKTSSFIYVGKELPQELDSFKGEILALIYDNGSNKEILYELVRKLQNKFKKPYIVISTVTLSISNGEYVEGINCVITSFDKTRLNYKLVYDIKNFKKTIYNLIEEDTKGFLIVSDGYIELEDISSDLELFSDYHFFGTLGNKSTGFSFNSIDNGMVIVSFSGDIEIHSYSFSVYHGIGPFSKVTKASKSRLYEIDGIKALDYYKKMFPNNQITMDLLRQFPLINNRIGGDLTYIPFKIYEDGSFEMPTYFNEGDKVRLSYVSPYDVESKFKEALKSIYSHNLEQIFICSSAYKYNYYKLCDFNPLTYMKKIDVPIVGAMDDIAIKNDKGVPKLCCDASVIVTLAENETDYSYINVDDLNIKVNVTLGYEEMILSSLDYLSTAYDNLAKDFEAIVESQYQLEADVNYIDSITGLFNQNKLFENIKNHQMDYNVTYTKFTHGEFLRTYYGNTFINKIRDEFIKKFINLLDTRFDLYSGPEGYFLVSELKQDEHRKLINELYDKFFRYGLVYEGEVIDLGIVYATVFKGNKHPIINAKRGVEEAIRTHRTYLEYSASNNHLFELKEGFDQYSLVSRAYQNKLFKVAYQGIYSLKEEKITRYEALIRIVDNGRVYNPNDFLNTAYAYGYSRDITKIIIEEVTKKIYETKKTISINLRVRDLEDTSLYNLLLSKIKKYEIEKYLVIEVLEDENLFSYKDCIEHITYLRSLGIKIAIDDFGTGYSNVNYFAKNCFDIVKIAGELTKELKKDNVIAIKMIEYIVQTAKAFGLTIIAEYCEGEEAASLLKEIGVDYVQGFYYSKPSTDNI